MYTFVIYFSNDIYHKVNIEYNYTDMIFAPIVENHNYLIYQMVYSKYSGCQMLFHITREGPKGHKVTPNVIQCDDCNENKCKVPKFLGQLSRDLHQSLESILDYHLDGDPYYILWFVIKGKPKYCVTPAEQSLSDQVFYYNF